MKHMNNRLLSVLLTLALVLGAAAVALPARADSDAYIPIGTTDELKKIGADDDHPLSGKYRLTADVSMDQMIMGTFSGVFDGNGYTVTLDVSCSDGNAGLFQEVSGTVENLITDGTIANTDTGGQMGAIAGALSGGTIRRCWNKAAVTRPGGWNTEGIAGIAGMIGNGTITDCLNTGAITVTGDPNCGRKGGIANANTGGFLLENCCSAFCPQDNGYYIIGGELQNYGSPTAKEIVNCFYYGDVDRPGESHEWNSTVQGAAQKLIGDAITDMNSYTGWDFMNTWTMGAEGPELALTHLYLTDVTGGTADKRWVAAGETVTVTADSAPTGMVFNGWTGADALTLVSGDASSEALSFTALANTELAANWISENAQYHDGVQFDPWDSADSLPTVAGNYCLTVDVAIGSTWNVPDGETNLCLSGHGIRMTGSGSVISVGSGATLSLYDCDTETEHKFTVSNAASNGAGLATVDDALTSGYQTFTGGYITGGSAANGGGIHVQVGGCLTLNGGTIIGNQAGFMGAGIRISHTAGDNVTSRVTMTGGAIMYNKVNGYGGGVCSDGGFTMTGGTISRNYATQNPGGVHCHYFYLSGGRIVDNYAGTMSFVAGAHADTQIYLSGAPVISGNIANGTDSNLDWDRPDNIKNTKLSITGALTEGAELHVTLRVGGTGVFTDGWNTYMSGKDPADYFVSDNTDYGVILSGSEVAIGFPPVASVTAGETTADYSSFSDAVSAWTDGSTLKLLADAATTATVSVSGTKTLDLNGFNLTATTASDSNRYDAITLSEGADLTLIGPGKVSGGYGWHGGGVYVPKNSSAVLDNCEISGNTGHYGGGLYLNGGTITLRNGTVVTGNNATDGFGGSGIYAEGGGTLIVEDGTFTANQIKDSGKYAVFLAGNANIRLSGTPVIYGNTYGGAQKNLFFYQSGDQDSKAFINGALNAGTHVGVGQMNGEGVFTVGWSTYMGQTDPADYFTSDNSAYVIYLSGSEAVIGTTPVAGVTNGETTAYYASIDDALNAWKNGGTLTLLKDVSCSDAIQIRPMYGYPAAEYTLDLNGRTLTAPGSIQVGHDNGNMKPGPKLMIRDSGSGGTINLASNILMVDYNGTVEFYGGTITGGGGTWGGAVLAHAIGYINLYDGVTFTGNNGQYGGAIFVGSDSVMNMYGGTITGNTANKGGGVIVSDNNNAEFNLYGGEISGNRAPVGGGVCVDAGSFHYYGGTVKNNTSDGTTGNDLYFNTGKVMALHAAIAEMPPMTVAMQTVGTFTAGWSNYMSGKEPADYFVSGSAGINVILSGGEATAFIPPEACVLNGSGAETFSGTFAGALSAWTDGSTLKLLNDVTTGSTVNVPAAKVTLDLNGHGIKAGGTGYSVITVPAGADLTITDSAPESTGGTNRPSGVTGGYITGGSVGQNYGGGVTVNGGTLRLTGGAISTNANTYGGIGNCGGGVHVRGGGAFYMTGGEISGNNSYVGGGIGTDTSATTVSVTGGTIRNNKTNRFGSAIFAGRSSEAILRIGGDAAIVNNISTWTGDKDGEGTLNSGSSIRLSGNPIVRGDWKTSGTSSPNTHINLDNDGSAIQRIELEGALTNETGTPNLTVTPLYRWNDLKNGQTFVFTKNWNTYMGTAHPAGYFKVDDGVTGVRVIRKDGEAAVTGGTDPGDLYVTFFANGGTGTMEPQLVTTAGTALQQNAFTRAHYSFIGWNTAADGSGTAYAAGDTFTGAADTVLYARWLLDTHTVTYDANGGSGTMTDTASPYGYGSTATVLASGFTRAHYSFTGWNTAADGSGTAYAAGDTFTVGADTTLYAQWLLDTHTVTYDANGGIGTVTDADSPHDYGSTATVLTNAFARPMFIFSGWNTAADGSGIDYEAGDTFTVAADTILYARWRRMSQTASTKQEPTPSAVFTATGADTGTLTNVDGGMKYRTGGAWTSIRGNSVNLTGLSVGTIAIYRPGNGAATTNSEEQRIKVTKAETPALTVTQPTTADGQGSVNTTAAHEFSADGGENWTTCTADQSFEPGVYLVRVKAAGSVLASEAQSVVITKFIAGAGGTQYVVDGKTVKTALNVSGESTPAVTVGNLDVEAVTESAGASAGATVELTMSVEAKPAEAAASSAALSGIATKGNTLEYLDIAVNKTVNGSTEALTETQNVLEIVVPYSFKGKEYVTVYRYHNGMAEKLQENDTGADGTFRLDKTNGLVYVYANKFSTYAIGYTPCFNLKGSIRFGRSAQDVTLTLLDEEKKQVAVSNTTSSNGVWTYRFTHIPEGTYHLRATWTDKGKQFSMEKPLEVK